MPEYLRIIIRQHKHTTVEPHIRLVTEKLARFDLIFRCLSAGVGVLNRYSIITLISRHRSSNKESKTFVLIHVSLNYVVKSPNVLLYVIVISIMVDQVMIISPVGVAPLELPLVILLPCRCSTSSGGISKNERHNFIYM